MLTALVNVGVVETAIQIELAREGSAGQILHVGTGLCFGSVWFALPPHSLAECSQP